MSNLILVYYETVPESWTNRRNEKKQSPVRRIPMFKPDKTVTRKKQALYL